MQETKETATDVIDKLYEKAESKLEKGTASAREQLRNGVRRTEDLIDDVADYVTRHPVSAVGWALAVGIATGACIAKITAPKSHHPFLDKVRDGMEAGEKSWRQMREGWRQVLTGLKTVMADARA